MTRETIIGTIYPYTIRKMEHYFLGKTDSLKEFLVSKISIELIPFQFLHALWVCFYQHLIMIDCKYIVSGTLEKLS